MLIAWGDIADLSYKSNLGKSLKKTLHRFDKDALFDELFNAIDFYITNIEANFPYDYRVKSIHSCKLKYDKYYPSAELERVYNDLLGIRIITDSYEYVLKSETTPNVRLVDLTLGKRYDDGYRAVHLYFQKDHFHYPIEVQVMTAKDKQFNEWLHIMVYKYYNDPFIGRTLREKFDMGKIKTEDDFRKELSNVLLNR